MTLVNKLQEGHEQAIFGARWVKSAQKKIDSKGKKYSQKDLKGIMQNIDFAVHANKVNGRYMDSYFENVWDDEKHILLSFHTGAMISRLEDFQNTSEKFQFTLINLAEQFPLVAEMLWITYYPVSSLKKEVNDEMNNDFERIIKYIKDWILIVWPNWDLDLWPKVGRASKKTLERAKVYYKMINWKLNKYFINPKFYNKYVWIVYSPNMDINTIKKYTAVNVRKSYVDKDDKWFLLDFALKIATRSYLMTINGKPIINVDEYFNQFPQIKELLENQKDIAEVNIAVIDKKYLSNVSIEPTNKLRMYTPFMSSIIAFDTNFPVEIKQWGSISYVSRDTLVFIKEIIWHNVNIPEKNLIDAIDYGKYVKQLWTIPKEPNASLLKQIAKIDDKVKRMLFIYNKLSELLEKEKLNIKKEKDRIIKIKDKFSNEKYYDIFIANTLLTFVKEDKVKDLNKVSWIYKENDKKNEKIFEELIKWEISLALKLDSEQSIKEIKAMLSAGKKMDDNQIEELLNEVKEDVKNKKDYVKDFELATKYTMDYADKFKKDADKQDYSKIIAMYELAF